MIDFLIKAKLSGYATGGESEERKFEDGSLGFIFKSNNFKYIDRYFGYNPFAGTEHLYNSDNNLLWKMNYYGSVLNPTSDPKKVYSFLSEAMSQITREYPFRGPALFKKDNFSYQNKQNGTIDYFHGIETIVEGNKKVYELFYHGGKMV